MLSENLKNLRKAKGFSQEELAARLHVVRQTVSKWEKGRSVPDAELLVRLADELDTTPAALLGPELPPEAEGSSTTAEQLGRIAEQLAVKIRRARRIWKIAAGVLIAFAAVNLLLILLNFAASPPLPRGGETPVKTQGALPGEASTQTKWRKGAGSRRSPPPVWMAATSQMTLRDLPLPA